MPDQQLHRQFVDITPTPDGWRNMKRLFSEQVKASQETLKRIETFEGQFETWYNDLEWDRQALLELILDYHELLFDGLSALSSQEHQRIATLTSSIEELEAAGY